MKNSKQHPLEVFRSSGQNLGSVKRDEAETAEKTPERRAAVPQSSREASFELHLSLPGSLVLLFVWVLLMGSAYLFGFSRGSSSVEDSVVDVSAMTVGEKIKKSVSQPVSSVVSAPSVPPYGVQVITYGGKMEQHFERMRATLKRKYGITEEVMGWRTTNDKIEVYVGAFEAKSDPQLKKLQASLRSIDDYPEGPKRPFATAMIKQHPRDPKASRKGDR